MDDDRTVIVGSDFSADGNRVAIILAGRASDILAQIAALEAKNPHDVFLIDMMRDLGDVVGMDEPAQMTLISDMLGMLHRPGDVPLESMAQWAERLRGEIGKSDIGRMIEPPMVPVYAKIDRHDGVTPRSVKESRRAQRRARGKKR